LLIRKARFEDWERIVDLNLQMAKETEGKILDENVVREGIKAVLDNQLRGFYLLGENDEGTKMIVGQLMITFEWSDWRNSNIWWIQSVYVDKKFRNRNVFSQLFNTVAEMALSEKSVGMLRLYVREDNNSAKQVYESLGMTKTPYEIYEKSV
jgi:ribosomal protein S18 acetylase RimI-like enzyme